MEKVKYFIHLLVVLLIILVIGFVAIDSGVNLSRSITGRATAVDVQTSAMISNYFAITASSNLSAGIEFQIATLPVTNKNATKNYNVNGETDYYILVEEDSNVNVDFCLKADGDLIDGSNSIGLGNYSWANSTSTDINTPTLISADVFTTSFVNGLINAQKGTNSYYRFWLSVPASQAPGTYLNQVNFKVIQTGNSC